MAWALAIDPTSESSSNTQFDLTTSPYDVMKDSVDWDDGVNADVFTASSADTEGDIFVGAKPNNRQVKMDIKVTAATDAALDTAVAQLQQKIGKLCRENGTLKRTTTGGSSAVLDVIYAYIAPKDDWLYQHSLTAVIPVRFTCLPYWRGTPIDTILDDFSADSIAKYAFDSGAGSIAVSGGQLVPSSTTEKRFYRSFEGLTYPDAQATVKVTTGASVASGELRLILKRLDGSNFLHAGVIFGGAASILRISRRVGGSDTNTSTGSFTTTAATNYWIRARIEGNLITCELWTSAPTPSGTATQSLTYTLAGSDATSFGIGASGQVGLRILPQATDYRYDDFQIDPYVYVEKTNPVLVTPPIYGLKGDVEPLGILRVNELASNDQWWAIWGNESRYFSQGVPTILDQFATDTIASGAWSWGAGAPTISGGLLVPSTTAQADGSRTDSSAYTDTRGVVKITTGASVASGNSRLLCRFADANNTLGASVNFAGAASTVNIFTRIAGSGSVKATSPAFTTTAATNYWLEFTAQAKSLTVSLYATDPATGSSPITNATISYTLTDSEYATFMSGRCGLEITPQATDYRYDDFRVFPLQGCTEALIGPDSLLVSGYSGTRTTRTGASGTGSTVANAVVRHTLANAYAVSCATAPRGNVGSYRVFARLYRPTSNTGAVSVAFEWGVGDLLRITRNDEVAFAADEREGDFTLTDLGRVEIPPATKGTQQWQGRIIAKSTVLSDVLDIDYLVLVPYAEGSGEASVNPQFTVPQLLTVRDEFDQTAGNLNTKALPAPSGHSWATVGADATDITVETSGHTATRSTTSDTSGKIAIAGTTTFTDVAVQCDWKRSAPVVPMRLIARYVDASNYLLVEWDWAFTTFTIKTVIAGVSKTIGIATGVGNVSAGNTYSMRLLAMASGRVLASVFPQGGQPTWQVAGSDTTLATGGTLATGKVGFWDINTTAVSLIRNYDNFWAGAVVADAVVFAGKQMEFRYDSTVRQDSTGAFWSPVSDPEGDYVKLLPQGREGRQNRIVLDTCRNDPDTMFDPSLSKTQAQLVHVPRYLSVPSS